MYRLLTLASCSLAFLSQVLAADTDAPVVENNPAGAQYLATINKDGLVAEIVVETTLNGRGVSFSININGNRPFSESDYMYHIHELPVPEDGNCTATKAHLDPYKRGEDPICDAANPGSCQVGDLSGKHGNIPTLPGFSANYTDDFVSLNPGTDAFMGDKSFVLHFPNKTRIACANFKLVEKDGASSSAGNGTIVGGTGSNSTASVSHGSHILTATSSMSTVGSPSRPTGSAVPDANAEGAAGKMKVQRMTVVGPVVFAIAGAVW